MLLKPAGLVGVVAALSLSAACNDASFKGSGARKGADATVQTPEHQDESPISRKTDKTLKLACTDGKSDARLVTEVKGAESTTVRLEGEFCGLGSDAKAGKLTVLFVLDYSGSMKFNDPSDAGTCGRLKAGQAILQKLEAAAATGDADVQVGIQAFSSRSIPGIAPTSLAAFKANLTNDIFCSNDGGETNYEAAFKAAETLLTPVDGTKVIYFISDGLPTQAGTGLFPAGNDDQQAVYDAGQAAAESLRKNVKDLSFDAIFLGTSTDPGNDPGVPTVDPQTYLEQIAGDKEHVRVVTSADDLAAKIVTFATPTASSSLDTDSVTGTLEAASFDGKTIKLDSLTQVAGRDGVWSFVTESFELLGSADKATNNIVTLSIKGADGKAHTAVAEIKFAIDESAGEP